MDKSEYMSGAEAIAHIMRATGCTREEARRELEKAIRAGLLDVRLGDKATIDALEESRTKPKN